MASANSAAAEGESTSVGRVRARELCTWAVVRPRLAASSPKSASMPSTRVRTFSVANTQPSVASGTKVWSRANVVGEVCPDRSASIHPQGRAT